MNNDTKPATDDLDKDPEEPNTPAQEAAKRLGFEPFELTERS